MSLSRNISILSIQLLFVEVHNSAPHTNHDKPRRHHHIKFVLDRGQCVIQLVKYSAFQSIHILDFGNAWNLGDFQCLLSLLANNSVFRQYLLYHVHVDSLTALSKDVVAKDCQVTRLSFAYFIDFILQIEISRPQDRLLATRHADFGTFEHLYAGFFLIEQHYVLWARFRRFADLNLTDILVEVDQHQALAINFNTMLLFIQEVESL